jgi:predicted nucleic acid-binding protein
VSGFAFDCNIIVDALRGFEAARHELERARARGGRLWISRIVWIEIMSKGSGASLRRTEMFLEAFGVDEIDSEIGVRAAALRRERPQLKAIDAIILATALTRGRVLVTRNTRDFPATMPGIRVPYTLPHPLPSKV